MKKISKKLLVFLKNGPIYLFGQINKFISKEEKIFYLFALVFCLAEASLFSRFQLFGVKPNLLLFLLTFYCYYFNFDFVKVILFSFICGTLKDLISSGPLGTNLFIFLLLGNLVSFLSRRFSRFNWQFILLLFSISVFGQSILYSAIQRIIFNNSVSLLNLFFRINFLELFYTLILFFAFFKFIKKCAIDRLS